ncbi:Hsp70 family protein, partial [Draconibacterium sp.]|nr:Hsp70 family protein [Draconibacterium sp.]
NFQLNFPENNFLKPAVITLKINEQNNSTPLFDDEILHLTDENEWASNYSVSNKVLNYKNNDFNINGLKLQLRDLNSKKKPLSLELVIKAKVTDGIVKPLGFVYYSNADGPGIKSYPIFAYWLLRLGPILLLIILTFVLIYYGKPLALRFNIDGYLDSYEIIDYKNIGKLLTPYNAWNSDIHSVDFLLVNGELKYKYPNFLLNWNSTVHLRLHDITAPNGFELFLKYNNDDLREFGQGHTMSIKMKRGKNFSFLIGIRQNNITRQIIDAELVKLVIEGVARDSKLLIKSDLRENLEYKFHIGKDLGDVWVGFDPGTTGSCVAVGSSTENIILAEDRPNNRIFTSVLAFNKGADFIPNGSEIPKSIYTYGERSKVLGRRVNEWRSFHSFKKLLGFKDSFDIDFSNGNILKVNGKMLAGLLVEGLYEDLYKFINRTGFDNREYLSNGSFKPLRAVVAIPNNFTISKTQDMVDCINNFSRFKEIRYVYEAEAVLFYYLSNYSKFNIEGDKLDSETILVFDMGGATINATVVDVNKTLFNNRPKYEIDLLGKIGYGIGGDTIDYCIAKFILSFTKEFPQLKSIDLFKSQVALAGLAFDLKKEFIANYKSQPYLITAFNLEAYIKRALEIPISIDVKTSEMYKYFVKVSGKYKLFEHPLFGKTIYNNIKDAVNEVIELSENIQIQKIIFSGRSTLFPMVKETVEKQLSKNNNKIKSIALDLEESKTAVAKGACWYGVNKNSVRLNNLKTNASFGFKKTNSADKTDVSFHELVEMGCDFDISNNGIDSFHGIIDHEDDFAFDGSKVNFYQVMGKNANKILSEGQKHKFSKIATINLAQITSKIAMKVSENDEVECVVALKSNPNRPLKETGVVADQEIDEANEEHYTWYVK